ncbi:MAG: hypothetical protein A2X12_09065 [Bacteroidetes bacterium GWE2_29_8]|nr:MAG: hypothetical protein A2X12_09065 [Bacteroidetes bacterium GWE2_29_8]OFY17153.1 MAG: hypothetical protein A2X02_09330 [Bacteroidetes bacterium GWF2_29_10]
MNTEISLESIIPIRKDSFHSSEMVSQILYGEAFQILGDSKEWLYIRTIFDNYEGWISNNQNFISKDLISTINPHVSSDLICYIKDVNNHYKQPVFMGSTIYFQDIEAKRFMINGVEYCFEGNVLNAGLNQKDNLLELLHSLLNIPYLWGGCSISGIDCSGFSQLIYKFLGIKLFRDASLQVNQGNLVCCLDDSQFGDLAFFDNENGRITHVGILLDKNRIIHASGRVKISYIDEKGIISDTNNKYSHKLKTIKRIF